MASNKCFANISNGLDAGEYINKKKSVELYTFGINLARNNGYLTKFTPSGRFRGVYRSNIFASTDGTQCLIGAQNYETLLNVTNGKWIYDPIRIDLGSLNQIWVGNLLIEDLSGVISIDSQAGTGKQANTFNYPPQLTSSVSYVSPSNPGGGGIIVDPSYRIFYANNVENSSSRGSCYLKNERSYLKLTKFINIPVKIGVNYISNNYNFNGKYYYPSPFKFTCSKEYITNLEKDQVPGPMQS